MIRPFLPAALALLTLGLAACTGGPPTITPGAPTEDLGATETATASAEKLTVEVLNTEVAVGFERVAFRLLDSSGTPISGSAKVEGVFQRVSIISAEQRVGQRVASGDAAYLGAEMPGGGSWVVYSDFDASGPWWLDANASNGDWRGTGRAELEVAARSTMPRVGDPPSTGETPKLGADVTVAELTSDPEPVEALYSESVADAKVAGRPAVVLFASPAHCQSEACAATLRELKKAQTSVGSKASFIHVESRDLADPAELSETAKAWGLAGEPWTFFVSPRGFIGARVEGELSAVEMQLLVERTLEP